MKIAHLVSTFPPYYGGMGNAVFCMAQEAVKHGHDVTVLTPRIVTRGILVPTRMPLVVRRLRPLARWGNAAFLPKLFWMLDDYDIVHLHYPFFGGAEVAALWRISQGRESKRRLMMTYHMDAIAGGVLGRFFAWYNRHMLPWILATVDRIIVTSFDYAEHALLKNHEVRMKNQAIEIPLGVDGERFQPRDKDEELLRRYKIQSDDFVLLFVGALDRAHAFKGVDVLLRSFKLFFEFHHATHGQNAWLMIVGDGALRPSYAALARDLEMQSHVLFTGRIAADDLSAYYSLADTVVLPSTSQSEAFGVVLLEAMASGRPVIASNLPGVRKVVVEKRTGILVKLGDVVGLAKAIEVFAQDPTLRARCGAFGRARVLERYTWGAVGEALESVYRI